VYSINRLFFYFGGVLIEIKQITKEYNNIKALDNISLNFTAGEFVCLVGPSGAGKSTLIKLLVREEKASSGQIIVADKDITKLKMSELPFYRRRIGVIFQDFKLLPQKTVKENISFALEVSEAPTKEINEKLPKILELVNLSHRANNYPDELSGGEKQRAAIARALVNSPKILIADEPTGNLDPINAWEITELLLRINQSGTLVILATHNKTVVDKIMKRVVTLRKGKIVSDQKIGKYLI
jgi:cell division transport system ATP-binding protein